MEARRLSSSQACFHHFRWALVPGMTICLRDLRTENEDHLRMLVPGTIY